MIESTIAGLRRRGVQPNYSAANAPTVLDTLRSLAERAPEQAEAENFPVALKVLPAAIRRQLDAAYAYARFVDDVGDESDGTPDDRVALLDVIDRELTTLDQGGTSEVTLPVIKALAPLLRDAKIPINTFHDLVAANRMDQRVATYDTFHDLLGYCELSAAPIGRIVLGIAHSATAENIRDSDSVCAALQVLEHCQDVGEDARSGRVYLPQADLKANRVPPNDLIAQNTSDALRTVILQQVARAEHLLLAGSPLVRRLSGWSRLAVSAYLAGGFATVHALRKASAEVLSQSVRPKKLRTAATAAQLIITGAGSR